MGERLCPQCTHSLTSEAVICESCDYILDAGFLGDDILNDDHLMTTPPKPSDYGATFTGEDKGAATVMQHNPLDDYEATVQVQKPVFSDLGNIAAPDTVFAPNENALPKGGETQESNSSASEVVDRLQQAESTFMNAQSEFNAGNADKAKVLLNLAISLHDDERFRSLLRQCDGS